MVTKALLAKLRERRNWQEIRYYIVRAEYNDNAKEAEELMNLANELFFPDHFCNDLLEVYASNHVMLGNTVKE
jgi:hypothetical protein